MKYRFLTSGESHGCCLNVIIEGVPANIKFDEEFINNELKRRQHGYGRGGRMKIESDKVVVKSGVRLGYTTGSPICLEIVNKDFENWQVAMSTKEQDTSDEEIAKQIKAKEITKLRPSHADLAGAVKYNQKDVRNILERSSARETAARVLAGAVAKIILRELDIKIFSHVLQIGKAKTEVDYREIDEKEFVKTVSESCLYCFDKEAENKMKEEIDKAASLGVTLGGKVEVICKNLPIGLGSFVHWDRKLDGKLSQAIMSINAVKSVEIGDSQKALENFGNEYHDEIFYDKKFYHKTNNAGGIEGGMTNGEDVVVKAVMKPIPTMKTSLSSVDLITKESYAAHFERSDVCAVSACGVVAEAMCAVVLVDEILEKFGGDFLEELLSNYANYKKYTESL